MGKLGIMETGYKALVKKDGASGGLAGWEKRLRSTPERVPVSRRLSVT